ncbi:MAG TPA: formylglycine-generating enzyme family protein [Lysobacter sp.]|nr:formylglycine-generating enzyme family protein [Lysobacter sp.]
MRTVAAAVWTGVALAALLGACSRAPEGSTASGQPDAAERERAPMVTISPDQEVSPVPSWQAPEIAIDADNLEQLRTAAAEALAAGELYGEPDDAIPLYVALRAHAPQDAEIAAGFANALEALIARGDQALAGIDDERAAIRVAHEVAAVARSMAPGDDAVVAYLARVDRVDEAQRANLRGERALNARQLGEDGKAGAIAAFREALELHPGDVRAMQGLAAAESALIQRAERAADDDDYAAAARWLDSAAKVRPQMETVADARERIARQRGARVGALRDLGIAALASEDGIDAARAHLADLLRIAPAGDTAAVELRERIELATHYGMFRPGQAFTEALRFGGRGPEMLVIPHGAFRMGAPEGEPGATDAERPTRNIRFERGLAVSRHEITVGEFRRFVAASGHKARATRRGHSTAYDERSGNLVRRSRVDWQSDYAGQRAADNLPVVHVSAEDAAAYASWLAEQTGQRYRLPSEAEFEYAVRAGSQARFPWGAGSPPAGAGNFTGALDQSPSGRRWQNAFPDYGDGAWGPAAAGSYSANAFGLHDMAGNVSEWVADCWHDSYWRAPVDGQAWFNPGCRSAVVRGGSWASSPTQTRSAWRLGSDVETTNARVGFRVVREI